MEKKKLIKTIINTVGRILMILSVIFVCRAIYRLGFDFSAIDNVPFFIITSLIYAVLFAVGVFIQGFAWKNWLDYFTHTVSSPKEALCVYARANIGKYLPGNVMHYVERNLFAAKTGASQTAVAMSSVFEIGTQVLVALLLAVICRGGTIFEVLDAIFPGGWRKYLVVAIISLAVLCVIVLIFLMRVFGERLKALISGYSIAGAFATLVKTMLLYMSVMLIGGGILALLYGNMVGVLTLTDFVQIVPGYVIAWVLGFVVPGAPGGIGVREFALTMLLSPVMGEELIVTLMVIHRLINIFGDFIAYLAAQIMGRNAREE